ncbi:MAG: SIMPL domain-containing protein [Gemmatimonadetes bacterium]|nr:SIMPL domain-containing protein [Gemmatimonadota bacterium]
MADPSSAPRRADGTLIAALLLAVGLALGGHLAGSGFSRLRTADRTVTVKGVSERAVKADLAIWPLRLTASDDDLGRANAALERSVRLVRDFLRAQGLDSAATEVTLQEFGVEDTRTTGMTNTARFLVRVAMVVRSTNVDRVLAASQAVADLARDGVVLTSGQQYGNGGPTFVFTGLNAIKPAMIAEVTARARESAEQFARDAGSPLVGIRTASQGVFEILPRDEASGITEESQVMKRVRLVSTVVYGLGD